MSCNYAEGLSEYEHKGKVGLPEIFDNDEEVESKAIQVAEWISSAKHVVVHTGAGISTSAGIPDFRGPNGVWTLEKKGLKPKVDVSFDTAQPTLTHLALVELVHKGFVKFIVSQNIDGLHMRSGLAREHLAEMHGNMFIGKCDHCQREFVQNNVVPTVGEKPIGVDCPAVKARGHSCRGHLYDTILDWEANLPENDLLLADLHSSAADLSICLGTTLQIVPSGNLPLNTKKKGGRLVICNLQPTKHDRKADLLVHTFVDKFMELVLKQLNLTVPSYNPNKDPVHWSSPLEWTVISSAIKKAKALVAQKRKSPAPSMPRDQETKTLKKPKVESVDEDCIPNGCSLKQPKEESAGEDCILNGCSKAEC